MVGKVEEFSTKYQTKGKKMELYQIVIYCVAGVAIITSIYIGNAGRAWFGTKETPDKILNKNIILKSIEAAPNGLIPDLAIEAIIKTYDGSKYYLEFVAPTKVNSNIERSAWISARHVGFPISSSKKNGILSVNGEFASGEQFLAIINLK